METSNFKNGSQDRDRQRKVFQIQPKVTKDIDLTFLDVLKALGHKCHCLYSIAGHTEATHSKYHVASTPTKVVCESVRRSLQKTKWGPLHNFLFEFPYPFTL